jgi:hypothetical protein
MPPPCDQGEQFVACVKAGILTAKPPEIWNMEIRINENFYSIPEFLLSLMRPWRTLRIHVLMTCPRTEFV